MLEVLFPVLFIGVLVALLWWTRKNAMAGRNSDGTRTDSTAEDESRDDDNPGSP
ncbi:hypothetical protein [Demequina flava]|uniref:hypothetical protein n=1 Tax=Demequina flava TaxID=1095025 RepID=UPI000AD811E1|nr:hypothetical protein [Demequina flava]